MAITDLAIPQLHELEPQNTGTAQLHAIEGFSEQRSFLLDDHIHVVRLWTHPRPGMGEITTVNSVRSFDVEGEELAVWSLLGSSQFVDRRAGGLYTQADMQPEGSLGRTNVSWMRIPHDSQKAALLARPHSMPREMTMVELSPEFHARINNVATQAGYLTLAK